MTDHGISEGHHKNNDAHQPSGRDVGDQLRREERKVVIRINRKVVKIMWRKLLVRQHHVQHADANEH
jgi:hypothetical protein